MSMTLAKYVRCRIMSINSAILKTTSQSAIRDFSATAAHNQSGHVNIKALLSKPTWSVKSLLPTSKTTETEVTPEKLYHLLRLSALPLPKTPEEEAQMLKTLHSQLHFVKEIQKVDTEGVEPLVAIRDETEEARFENTIGLETLEEAFANEETKGRNQRPRRRRDAVVDTKGAEDWDALGTAGRTSGKYFIVNSSKE